MAEIEATKGDPGTMTSSPAPGTGAGAERGEPDRGGPAATESQPVGDPGEARDLTLEPPDLGAEGRVVGRPVPAEESGGGGARGPGHLLRRSGRPPAALHRGP